jgi:hypothetical protein
MSLLNFAESGFRSLADRADFRSGISQENESTGFADIKILTFHQTISFGKEAVYQAYLQGRNLLPPFQGTQNTPVSNRLSLFLQYRIFLLQTG